jgi:tetratricopeptide (TPR) repeat protein
MKQQSFCHSPGIRLSTILFLSVAVSFTALEAAEGRTAVGQVRSLAGDVVTDGVTLRLETTDGTLIAVQTGSTDGRFQFNGLSMLVYKLTVTATGFQPFATEVDLSGYRPNISVDVTLVPSNKTKSTPATLAPMTDEAAPKRARKEYEKGSRALDEQNFSEAQLHFQKAIDQYPCYARAQTDLALTLMMRNDAAHAEAALRKSIACDRGFLPAYTRLGRILNSAQRYADCQTALAEGLRLSPNSWELHYQLGDAHAGLHQYAKAEREYLKVRSLNPAAPAELHVKLADLYYQMKVYDKSMAEMRAYLLDDPDGRYADRTKVILQEMESTGVVHAAETPPSKPQP